MMIGTWLMFKRAAVCAAATAMLLVAFGVSSAFGAGSAWWGLTSGSWPTHLQPGAAKNEVHEVTVTATGGDVLWVEPEAFEKSPPEIKFAVFPFNATHEVVQSALEGLYGAGNVEVSGGPVGKPAKVENEPYLVTFTGALGGAPVQPIDAGLATFACVEGIEAGPCLEGTVAVSEKIKGQPDGQIVVTAENMGDASVDGSSAPVVVEDVLPEHLEAVHADAEGASGEPGGGGRSQGDVLCSVLTPHLVRCTYGGVLSPYEQLEVRVGVRDVGASSGEENSVSISGGGASAGTLTRPISVGGANGFGVEDYKLLPEEEGGAPSTQAGVHPFQLTTALSMNTSEATASFRDQQPAGMVKDVTVQLPPGLIGNPTPFPQCSDAQFTTQEQPTLHNSCEAKAAIGVVLLTYNVPGAEQFNTRTEPVFNLKPLVGEPARFGFENVGRRIYIDTSVRSGGDYGVTATVSNITEIAGVLGSKLTFWGVPGDPAHDHSRGWACLEGEANGKPSVCPAGVSSPPPFLSMPTSCSGAMRSTVQADSWEEPHPSPAQLLQAPLFAEDKIGGLDGCNRLQFNPQVRVTPDGTAASSPTGLNVDVHVPQGAVLNAEGLAESAVRDISVALPEGVAVNPSGGDGLQACSQALAGFQGFAELETVPHTNTALFTPTLPNPLEQGLNFCANASKIGELTVHSPLLPPTQPLKGFVYLATQNQNPFGSLIALYLIAEDPVSGTVFKGVGETHLTASGQVIGTFKNNPQLAFEDAELHFFGGERAPLATPAHCGPYTTTAAFVPWSAEPGEAPHTASSTFNITEGPNHTPCPGAQLPFNPSLTGGATNVNAGAFSPFTLTMSRKDGEQNLQSVEAHLPPGLSGVLSNIELCPEPQANEGKCGPNSLIGESTVSVGVGGDPFSVSGGKFYLTGPYNGSGGCKVGEAGCAPFGLTFEVPAKAGPFDLKRNSANPAGENACDCVIVRGKIEIDPLTAALTITSDPPGSPYAIPTSIEGIPLEIQHVNAITTRGNFQFNPTNCSKMEVTGTIHSSENATATVGVPFQVTNCGALKFTPKFQVSTDAKTSKAGGASLTARVSEPAGSLGTQANLARVKVELPKQLPSRLTTLQKACTSKQFEANPAACPPESKIGYAKVITPLVPVPLEGPAIFVSHGGEAFPSLTMVLQGYGVTIDLVGTTFISKAGVTSTTFKTVPDQPFSSFQLTLPTGKYSALTANGSNLCKVKGGLKMPTEFIAQNGLKIKQSTKITVTGCPKAKRLTRAQLLAVALKACRKQLHGHKRHVCEARARKRYGPVKKADKGARRNKR
jgi:hypothetical protein